MVGLGLCRRAEVERQRAEQGPARLGDDRRLAHERGRSDLGKVNRYVVQLAIALFTFILVANWLELIPSGDDRRSSAPTADVNLTYALALIVIVGVTCNSVRRRGTRGYFAVLPTGRKILHPAHA